jgi:hypothetical protein
MFGLASAFDIVFVSVKQVVPSFWKMQTVSALQVKAKVTVKVSSTRLLVVVEY